MVHTLWAAIRANPVLTHLQGNIESALVRVGIEPERRKYTPHVTIARIKKSPKGKVAAWLADHGGFNLPAFDVDQFVLYRSHLGHSGPHYETIARYDLVLKPE
jgi:2'-5' RNA ligase